MQRLSVSEVSGVVLQCQGRRRENAVKAWRDRQGSGKEISDGLVTGNGLLNCKLIRLGGYHYHLWEEDALGCCCLFVESTICPSFRFCAVAVTGDRITFSEWWICVRTTFAVVRESRPTPGEESLSRYPCPSRQRGHVSALLYENQGLPWGRKCHTAGIRHTLNSTAVTHWLGDLGWVLLSSRTCNLICKLGTRIKPTL